jgi:3-hydroxyacyl-CoA dehydrogenase
MGNSGSWLSTQRVGVVGLGLMGHGIAQAAAEKGFQVTAVELEPRFLDSGMKRIADSVHKMASKAASKGKVTETEAKEHAEQTLSRITPSTDRAALGECDLIIEAVIEDLSLKKPLYEDIGRLASDTTVIASNTSSLPITQMAHFCGRPSQMVGLHFFNPVQLMPLVEVVKTDLTCVAAHLPWKDFEHCRHLQPRAIALPNSSHPPLWPYLRPLLCPPLPP